MSDEIGSPFKDDHSRNIYVSTVEMIVSYRPFAEWENWVRYRLSEKSKRKTIYIAIIGLCFIALGGPFLVLQLIKSLLAALAGHAGAAGAAGTADQMFSVVAYFYAVLAAGIAASACIYYTRPTHLSLSDRGLRFIFDHKVFSGRRLYYKQSGLIPWQAVSGINITRPADKRSPHQNYLTMTAGSVPLINLRLGAFLSPDDRAHVLEAIEKWAPQIARQAEVIRALEPPADHSYTELWMKALSAPPKREKLKPLAAGALLKEGRYEVAGSLGVGGQGTAYLAYDIGDQRQTVVLKEFILPIYVDISLRRQALDRFEHEAKILKQLDHAQIVRLVDFFVEDHRGYLVLEHIDGFSLRQLVERQGRLPEEKARALALQMCEILRYLHGLTPPLVHRDFTPDNLILRNDGTLKLVDFNVAQRTESTMTGTVVGKQAYLPPEQFRGLPTTQSDIYAMGATLYYLVTGEDPEPISRSHPRDQNPAISEEFNRIVAQATEVDAGLRYRSANEIAVDIESTTDKIAK